MKDMGVLHAALEYHENGWSVIPTQYKTKLPVLKNWTQLRLTQTDIRKTFNNASEHGLGVLLGAISNNLLDIDLDTPESQRLWQFFPSTKASFGREDKPVTHLLYYIIDNHPVATRKFIFKKIMVLEMRGDGTYTLFPPSVHPDGDVIHWHIHEKPTGIEYRIAERRCAIIASASLFGMYWPNNARHHATGALAGALARSGWTQKEVELFVSMVAIASNDNEYADRQRFVRDTFTTILNAAHTTGWPTLIEIVGNDVVDCVRNWLHIVENEQTFAYTDTGLAERLVNSYGKDIRYSAELRKWFIWNGKLWKPDNSNDIYEKALDVVKAIPENEGKYYDSDDKKKLLSFAFRSQDQKKIDSMVDLTGKTQSSIKISTNELDSNPYLLNVQNGTIDLFDGKFYQHNRQQNITKIANVVYDEQATCETFTQFINQIFANDVELIQYVQKAIGYSCTAVMVEKALFACHGISDTGKTTFLADIFQRMLGVYALQVREEAISHTKFENTMETELAGLLGIRFALVSEPSDGMRLHEARIKAMTGRNKLKARFLYANPFEFDVTHKLWIDTNYPPIMSNRDDAIWRRIKLIPFLVQIPKDKQDKFLAQKLEKEFSGILNWIIQGALLWKNEGLEEPQTVIDATFEVRQEMDSVGTFIKDRCELGEEFLTDYTTLREEYKVWCEDLGISAIQSGGQRNLWQTELSRNNINKTMVNGKLYWKGVRMRSH